MLHYGQSSLWAKEAMIGISIGYSLVPRDYQSIGHALVMELLIVELLILYLATTVP